MSIQTTSPTETTESTQSKDIGELPFPEYEAARRAGVKPGESTSAPEAETSEQKPSSKSEPEETEADDETEADTDADDAEDSDSESEKAKSKKKGGFQRRIDKLNARFATAQQEAAYWREQALKRSEGEAKKNPETKAAVADGKPDPNDFDSHAEYVEALTDWKTEQKFSEREQKAEKTRLESEQAKEVKAFEDRIEAFKKTTPDYDEVMAEASSLPVKPHVLDLLVSSENGPALIYELAKNPEEFERINALAPLAVARELGKIESKIEARASAEKKPEPKKLTNAPKPIAPVGGSKGQVSKTPEEMSFTEYVDHRRKQLKRRG